MSPTKIFRSQADLHIIFVFVETNPVLEDVLYYIALKKIPLVGDVRAKTLIQTLGSAKNVLQTPSRKLEKLEGIGKTVADAIQRFDNYAACEKEIAFLEKYKIVPLLFTQENYPARLRNCVDAPPILFFKGTGNINAQKIISVIGTRNNTAYGKQMCEKLIADIAAQNVLVVSGLAFGIDSIAHKSALQNGLETMAVVGHGLDSIYPSQNTPLAKQILERGGLLSDFLSGVKPDKQNFPRRNRIVAGICDALIVVESGKDGGSLITAELANGYNKDVFAFPGKANDSKSEGCNNLIKMNKAALITCANDLLQMMNWMPTEKQKKNQRALFIDLSPDEKVVYDILQKRGEGTHIDDIFSQTNLPASTVFQVLLKLEMENVLQAMPGKIYKIL